jgi:two-component system, OmpR family, response regulator
MSNNQILIVDDNAQIADVAKIMLESYGYTCVIAKNGYECLDNIDKNKFDLVLLDLAMPEFTGIDVLHQLRDKGLLSQMKIVFFTSSIGTAEITDYRKVGAIGCIRKPFRKAELLEAVKSFIAA